MRRGQQKTQLASVEEQLKQLQKEDRDLASQIRENKELQEATEMQ